MDTPTCVTNLPYVTSYRSNVPFIKPAATICRGCASDSAPAPVVLCTATDRSGGTSRTPCSERRLGTSTTPISSEDARLKIRSGGRSAATTHHRSPNSTNTRFIYHRWTMFVRLLLNAHTNTNQTRTTNTRAFRFRPTRCCIRCCRRKWKQTANYADYRILPQIQHEKH